MTKIKTIGKYRLLRQVMLDELRIGRWRPGEKLPPLPILAQELDASQWAVDQALRLLISEGVLFRQPKTGTYVRQDCAINAFNNAPIVVLGVNPGYWRISAYLGSIIGSFAEALPAHDWVFLQDTDADALLERLKAIGAPVVVSAVPRHSKIPDLEKLAARGFRVLCLGSHVDSPRLHSIGVDNIRGVMLGLRMLARLGHRRVGFVITHTDAIATRDRILGFQAGVRELGMDEDPALLVGADHAGGPAALVRETMDAWLAMPHPPTAIFSGGEALTGPLLDEISRRNIAVPDDISLIAFDEAPLADHLARPLTVIRQPLAEVGRQAARTLPLIVENDCPPLHIVLAPELVIRASCGAPGGMQAAGGEGKKLRS